jgi:hypothetical protein
MHIDLVQSHGGRPLRENVPGHCEGRKECINKEFINKEDTSVVRRLVLVCPEMAGPCIYWAEDRLSSSLCTGMCAKSQTAELSGLQTGNGFAPVSV